MKKSEISIKKLKDLDSNMEAPKQIMLTYLGENRKLGLPGEGSSPVFTTDVLKDDNRSFWRVDVCVTPYVTANHLDRGMTSKHLLRQTP